MKKQNFATKAISIFLSLNLLLSNLLYPFTILAREANEDDYYSDPPVAETASPPQQQEIPYEEVYYPPPVTESPTYPTPYQQETPYEETHPAAQPQAEVPQPTTLPWVEPERIQEVAYEESHPVPTPQSQSGGVSVVTDNASQQVAVTNYNNQGSSYERDYDNTYSEVRADLTPQQGGLAQNAAQAPGAAVGLAEDLVNSAGNTFTNSFESIKARGQKSAEDRLDKKLAEANASFDQAASARSSQIEAAFNAPSEQKAAALAQVWNIPPNTPPDQAITTINQQTAGTGLKVDGDLNNFTFSTEDCLLDPLASCPDIQISPEQAAKNREALLKSGIGVANFVTGGAIDLGERAINIEKEKDSWREQGSANGVFQIIDKYTPTPTSADYFRIHNITPTVGVDPSIKVAKPENDSVLTLSRIQQALSDSSLSDDERQKLQDYASKLQQLQAEDEDATLNVAAWAIMSVVAGPVRQKVGTVAGSVVKPIIRPLADVLEPFAGKVGGFFSKAVDQVGSKFGQKGADKTAIGATESVVVKPSEEAVTRQIMRDYNTDPDTIVYRVTPKKYVENGVICGNPQSCALIRDIYNPIEHPLTKEFAEQGLDTTGLPKIIAPLVTASKLEHPSLNVAIGDPSDYAREGYVKVGIRLGDILEQGGKLYPDQSSSMTGALIVTTPKGGVKVVSVTDLIVTTTKDGQKVVSEDTVKQVAAQGEAQEAKQLFQSQFKNKVVEKTGERITGDNARFTSTRSDVFISGGDNLTFWGTHTSQGDVPPRINNIDLGKQQGQGLGSALVKSFEETVADEGYSVASIQHVKPEAEGFWRKMGYSPVDIPGNEREINSVWVKPLTKDAEEAIQEAKQHVSRNSQGQVGVLDDFLARLKEKTNGFLKDKPGKNEINRAVNEVNQEMNSNALAQPGKKTSFWQNFVKEVLAEGKDKGSSLVIDSENYELLVKQKIIKNRLAQKAEVQSEFIKNTLATDISLGKKIKTTNGYILVTGEKGTYESEIDGGLYKVELIPMEGVDIQSIGTIQVDQGKRVTLPVGIAKGAGKVDRLQTLPPIEGRSQTENSTNLNVVVFSDPNKNGILDNNEEILPWAGVQIHLTKLDHTQSLSLLTGWNLVTLNALPDKTLPASSFLGEIAKQGGYATTVSKLEDGAWKTYVKRGETDYSGDDFVIEAGKAYFVKVLKPVTFKFSGQEFVSPLKTKLTSGWNAVGLPKTKKVYKASEVIDEINTNNGVSDAVARWQYTLWDTLVKKQQEKYGKDFLLENNRGYLIRSERMGEFEL